MRIYLFIFFLVFFPTLQASDVLIDSLFSKMNRVNDAEKDFRWQEFVNQLNDSISKVNSNYESQYLKTKFIEESNQLFFGGVIEFEKNKPRLVWGIKNFDENNESFIFYNNIDYQSKIGERINLNLKNIPFVLDDISYNKLLFYHNESVIYEVVDVELKLYFQKIIDSIKNGEKEDLSEKIGEKLVPLLNAPSFFDDKFSGLDKLSTLISNDKKLKICTWNIQFRNGIQKMYGAVAVRQGVDAKIVTSLLNDEREKLRSPERSQLSPQKWYGAVYYEIIEVENKKDSHYILLGYNGNNHFSKIRVVEVVKIANNNRVFFGFPIFLYERDTKRRVVFEYSSRVNMMLRYEPKVKMIVFDHLAPAEPMFTGDFRHYGPDFTYDGFSLKNGKWHFISEIDLRNPSDKKRKK